MQKGFHEMTDRFITTIFTTIFGSASSVLAAININFSSVSEKVIIATLVGFTGALAGYFAKNFPGRGARILREKI